MSFLGDCDDYEGSQLPLSPGVRKNRKRKRRARRRKIRKKREKRNRRNKNLIKEGWYFVNSDQKAY